MSCAHIYNVFLRGQGSIGFINGTGWVFMGLAAFNILGNLAVVVIDTLVEAVQKYLNKRQEKKRLEIVKSRRESRQKIVDKAPGVILDFEKELSVYEAISRVKAWLPERRWLIKNKVVFEDYPEEIEFKKLCRQYRLLERAQFVRMTRS